MASVEIELVQQNDSGITEQEPKEADPCLQEKPKTFQRSQSKLQRARDLAQARWRTLQQ